ncbi:MAG: DUF2953 domain-containing protein [Lachnospiraceae bacterium]|nr:DUF2953 domain-containing protein [Lachnospiraceae bacterium]
MLHILWLILKIILIVLAIVLGLVLLIVLLVLFAPIRYKVAADIDEDIGVVAKVRFLIVSVGVLFEKKGEENNLDTAIRICGIRINKKDKDDTGGKDKKSKKERKKRTKADEAYEEEKTDTAYIDKAGTDADDKTVYSEYDNDASEAAVESSTNEIETSDGSETEDIDEYDLFDDESEDKDKKKLLDRIKQFFIKAKDKMSKIKDKPEDEVKESILTKIEEKSEAIKKKYEEIEKKYRRFEKFWNLKCTVRTREYIGKYLISILKHIAPKKIKGRIRYGMDEPYKTGTVTGYLSLMPFVYQKHFSLEPDFYEKVIEGNVELKGRIVLGYIARIALKPYIWQTIKAAKRLNN